MVFSSVTFLFFFLSATLLLYYLVPKALKNLVLLLASLLFYAWGEPLYVLLMLYSIFFNYRMGLLIGKFPKAKKQVLVFTLIVNLLILGFFKYYGFLVGNLNSLFGLSIPVRTLALPVGISFYTFQALSYIIDLYRGKFPPQKNPVRFACYITMFPQLIAGPIVRYEDIESQLASRKLSGVRFGRGTVRFLFGLFKKVLLANQLGSLFDTLHAGVGSLSPGSAWLMALAYTFQIYFDFSGYSDMAIGLGDMLGFSFMENFNYPYIASSVTDFWRRWHISLSSWFREYVYIPLGGNRVSVLKHIRNILVVWLLTGLWHGAAWNFILWGVYYGLLLLFEKYIWQKLKIPGFLNRILTAAAVIVGWVIFSSESLPEILTTLSCMAGKTEEGFFKLPFLDTAALYYLRSYGLFLIAAALFSTPLPAKLFKAALKKGVTRIIAGLLILALFILCVSLLVTQNYNPFLYFRF